MKVTQRTLQAQETKSRIFQTSMHLFKEHGFDQVTIQDIANAAGVSVGSFYNYFPSKQEILHQSFHRADEAFHAFVKEGVPGITGKEQMKAYMLFYIDFVLTHPYDFIKNLYNTDNPLFLQKGRAMQTLLHPFIEAARTQGELGTDMSTEEITEFLYLSMRGLIFHWCLANGEFDLHQRADRYLDLLLQPL